MSDWHRHVERLADIFFNGRKSEPEPESKRPSLDEIISRKNSVVRYGGKLYEIKVREIGGKAE